MAINRNKEKQAEETAVQTQGQVEVESQASVEEKVEGNSISPENGKKRRGPAPGVPRGPLATPGVWEEGGDEARDNRDKAMFAILKAEKASGSIRTADSVAAELAKDKDLFPRGLKAFDVASRVRTWTRALSKDGGTPPSWMRLDEAKPKPSVNLALFE